MSRAELEYTDKQYAGKGKNKLYSINIHKQLLYSILLSALYKIKQIAAVNE